MEQHDAATPPGPGRKLRQGDSVGRYLILERVGEGGMGVVYAAWDPDLGRRVAIKLLRTDKQLADGPTRGQARLLREAQAMARVTHPNVISVYDVGPLDDSVFVAMEFVDGSTLRKWVKEKRRGWRELLDAFMAAGRGLAGAHAAGLVHRDFKPDNVLIGKDGRIRVTDFGLARLADEGDAEARDTLPAMAAVPASAELAQITRDDVVVGTPMYMAPEQRRGEPPDARSDQFSFCVALYWALYGVWPFDRNRLPARGADSNPGSSQKGTQRDSQRTNNPRPVHAATGAFEPPQDAKVPGFLQRAVMRGLSPDPAKRFASMDALLAHLEYRPRMIRRAAAAAACVLVASGGAGVWYTQQTAQSRALLCTGAEQKLAGIWDQASRKRVTDSLVATGQPQAAEVASRVSSMLDEYARGWVEASTEACRATRLRGEQTEALMSLRVVCLERRLHDLKAVTGVLATADAELVGKASDTISLLPSVRGCEDVAALNQVEPPPDAPQAREEIERISRELAQLKALTDAGRYDQGLAVATPALKAASTLGYRPLEAEALLRHGWLLARRNELAPAERHLFQALGTALASRNDEVVARAATMLVFVVGFDRKRFDATLQWSHFAKAALTRLANPPDIESELLNNLGVAHLRQNHQAEALTAFQQSLQLVEKHLGPEHARRANVLGNLGIVHRKEGRFEEARRALGDALALRERLSGANHPMTANLHYALAQTYISLRDFEKAQGHAHRALGINLATFGPEHPQVGGTYDVVGHAYLGQGQYRQAQENYEKALAIKEKALGKTHVDLSYSVVSLAECALKQDEPARALTLYERVLALNPPSQGLRAEAYFGMAQALGSQKPKRSQALELARKARAEYEQAREPQGTARVDAWLAQHASAPSRTRTARNP
jgi:tetratricopeptide (TPR) repeat protein/tRNA A-37 threonylcarbamoyl transferase component Bud32